MPAATAVLVNDTRVDRHVGCQRVVEALIALLERRGIRTTHTLPAHADWRSVPEIERLLGGTGVVVVNGEGTLHDDAEQGKRLLEIAAFARPLGTPSVLVNCLWENNGAAQADLLRDFALIAARDARSASVIRALGHECLLTPDFSLYAEPDIPPRERSGVAVTDSVYRPSRDALERHRRYHGLDCLSVHTRGRSRFGAFGYLVRGRPWSGPLNPVRMVRDCSARLAMWRSAPVSADDFLQQLAGRELLLSARFHACTLALLVSTPFAALPSNTAKIATLVDDAGLDRRRLLEPEQLGRKLDPRGFQWTPAELGNIRDYLAQGRKAMEQLGRRIGQLL